MANYADQMKTSAAMGWHVYVIAEEGGAFCKIGSAVTPQYRRDHLQNGNPRHLRIAATWHLDGRDEARAVEAQALANAGLLRLDRRDWLECSPDAAVSFVRAAMARLGITEKTAHG